MKEQEVLYKLNKMKRTHEISSLRRQVIDHQKAIISYKSSFKDAADQYHSFVQESIKKLQSEIDTLNKEKIILQNENKTYKNMLNRIPNFIVKLFNKNDYKHLAKGVDCATEKKQ